MSIMTPPSYLTPDSSRWRAMLEHQGISDPAKVLLCWLVFSAEPSDGAVRAATLTAMAEALSWSRQKVGRALAELYEAGMVDHTLSRGSHRGGTVRLLAYYDVMKPTKWLSRQRAIGTSTA